MNEYKTIRKMMDEDHKSLPADYKMMEDYQVMCEARVFSQCPDCKKDWDDCKCKQTKP